MIIDIHTHARWKGGKFRCHPGPDEGAAMLDLAARQGIDALCLLGCFYSYPDAEGIRAINDATLAMVRRHPGRLFGLCFLNPALPADVVMGEMERCLDAGLSGVKLEYEINARDPRLDPIMEKAAERDVFVLHHAWYKTIHKMARESDPSDIAHLAARHPRTQILMAHLSACGMRGVLDIKAHPNVSVDTSGSVPVAGLVEYAVHHLGAERVVFGSDFPIRDFSCQIGRIAAANLREDDRNALLGKNAACLLKIPAR